MQSFTNSVDAMVYLIHKKNYIYLCQIGGTNTYNYTINQTTNTYVVYACFHEDTQEFKRPVQKYIPPHIKKREREKERVSKQKLQCNTFLKINIKQPHMVPDRFNLKELLGNISDIKYLRQNVYTTGLEYQVYECNIRNMEFDYMVTKITNIEYYGNKKSNNSSSIPKKIFINFVLFSEYSKNNEQKRLDISKKNVILPSPRNTFYAFFPYFDQDIKYIFYYISIIDENIKTLYDFKQIHVEQLTDMKKNIVNWLREEKKCMVEQHIRIYTYFPSESYPYPYFYVDYHDNYKASYSRLSEVERLIYLDDLIDILEKNGDLKELYVTTHIKSNHQLYKLAQEMIKKTSILFINIFNKIDKDIPNTEIESGIAMIFKTIQENPSDFETIIPIDSMENIASNPEYYKFLHYFQKFLIKSKNEEYYPFITEYIYLTKKLPVIKNEPVTKKHNPTTFYAWRNPENNPDKNPESNPLLSASSPSAPARERTHVKNAIDFKNCNIIELFYDYTRPNTHPHTIFGILYECSGIQYIANFISLPLFKHASVCTSDEIPLIATLRGEKIAKWINPNPTPYLMEILQLPYSITDKKQRVLYDMDGEHKKYDDLLYDHRAVNNWYYPVRSDRKQVVVFMKETDELIKERLQEMTEIKIDARENKYIYAAILYKYTDSDIIRDIIRKYVFDNIPKEWIYYETYLPFIALNDKYVTDSYKNNPLTKLGKKLCDFVFWHTDYTIYLQSLDVPYIETKTETKTVRQVIEYLKTNPDTPYPFILGKIGKFIKGNTEDFPHTFKYVKIELLDDLFIFINYFKNEMNRRVNAENAGNFFSLGKNNKIDFINDEIYLYFHNTKKKHSILHLHFRHSKMNKKLRHIFKGKMISEGENKISPWLNVVYMNILREPTFYKNKYMDAYKNVSVSELALTEIRA